MSKTIERALRHQTDPQGILPRLRLREMKSVCASDYQNFKIVEELSTVGTVMLHRWVEPSGRPVSRVENLSIAASIDPMSGRYAATLAILAMTSQEGSTLVSDQHGSSNEDVATWYWLIGEGLAVVDTAFTPRPNLFQGSAIYDGFAYAPPVTLRG